MEMEMEMEMEKRMGPNRGKFRWLDWKKNLFYESESECNISWRISCIFCFSTKVKSI